MWSNIRKCLSRIGIAVLIACMMVWLMPSLSHGENTFTVTITSSDGSTSTVTTSGGSTSTSASTSSGPAPANPDPLTNPYVPLPPYQPTTHHSSGSSSGGSTETVVKTTDVTGKGWTKIRDVNVRTLASTKSALVRRISSRESEVTVNTEVLNSAGETWYGVKLYSGHVGYIRGDLLEVEIEEAAAEEKETSAAKDSSAAESKVDTSAAGSAESTVIVYVVTVSDGREVKSVRDDAIVVYLTPEEAEKLNLLTFTPAEETDDYGYDTDDGLPVNG